MPPIMDTMPPSTGVLEQVGHLECLKYAHEHGCPWDENTCYVLMSCRLLLWTFGVFEVRARATGVLGTSA